MPDPRVGEVGEFMSECRHRVAHEVEILLYDGTVVKTHLAARIELPSGQIPSHCDVPAAGSGGLRIVRCSVVSLDPPQYMEDWP